MSVLEVTDLGYELGNRQLLADVTFSLEAGSLLALVGPNGAGKSTLVRLLSGELEPTRGEVRLFGRSVGDWPARELARRRAVMPQQTVLQFAFTAEEVIAMGRSPHRARRGGPRDDQIVAAAMEQTETTTLARQSFPTLSGGEQARVTLARVLAQEADILLLDEPTASLDLRHQEIAMRIARALADQGRAILAVTHDVNLAAAYADEAVLLREGRVVASGSPWEALTAETLHDVFDQPVIVIPHPVGDWPLVVTAGGSGASRPRAVARA